MTEKVRYTEPVLCHHDYDLSKAWFVYFDITNNISGQVKRKQYRAGINYHHTVRDRLRDGEALLTFWKRKLRDGYDPFYHNHAEKLANMNFGEALEFAYSDIKASSSTLSSYRTCKKFILDGALRTDIFYKKMQQVKRSDIKLVLKNCHKKNKWSNTSYNKYKSSLCAILGRLIEWEVIENNPAEKIKNLPVTETRKFIPYTVEEKNKIREYFYLNHYRYYVILMLIYHAGIRPKEVLALKIKDIDLRRQMITIVPEIELENSKTKSIRKIPINKQLLPFLRELQLDQHPRDHYVFGSPYQKGLGNRGMGKMRDGHGGVYRPEYFMPSAVMVKRDTITKFWKKIVIDKLGIQKHLYAAKHTGADDKILSGITLDALKDLYGHSSKLMTEKYVSVLKEVHFKEIQEKSPAF